jgi:hemoglobin
MITEAEINRVVEAFYAKVRKDDLLAPMFEHAVQDWPEHLRRFRDFWSIVLLRSGTYRGNPMFTHLRHRDAIEPAMFDRLLELWRATALEILPPPAAAVLAITAERVAESLKLGLYIHFDDSTRG